jgi:hypothetical protein
MSEIFFLNELFLNLKVNKVRIIFLNSSTNSLTQVLLETNLFHITKSRIKTIEHNPSGSYRRGLQGWGMVWCPCGVN